MKATLHLRAEYGEIRIHPPFDLDRLADLVMAWRAAESPSAPLTALLDAEEALREYLRLDLDVVAAHGLAQELQDAGVTVVPF